MLSRCCCRRPFLRTASALPANTASVCVCVWGGCFEFNALRELARGRARLHTHSARAGPSFASKIQVGKGTTYIVPVGQLRAGLDAVIAIFHGHHLHRAELGPDELDVVDESDGGMTVRLCYRERVLGQTYAAGRGVP